MILCYKIKNNDVYSLVIDKLKQTDENPFIIKWCFSFLTNRTQNGLVNKAISDSQVISTRAPKGV